MRKLFLALLINALFLSSSAFAVAVPVNMATTALPATYGAAGNQYSASGTNKDHICFVNGSSTQGIWLTTSAVATCTGAVDQWFVPAGLGACFETVLLLKYICARSNSGTLSSGTNVLVYWGSK